MAMLDEILAGQDPGVLKAIEDLCERAGTWDADPDVLVEAGRMINGLRGCLTAIQAGLTVLATTQRLIEAQQEINNQLRLFGALQDKASEEG